MSCGLQPPGISLLWRVRLKYAVLLASGCISIVVHREGHVRRQHDLPPHTPHPYTTCIPPPLLHTCRTTAITTTTTTTAFPTTTTTTPTTTTTKLALRPVGDATMTDVLPQNWHVSVHRSDAQLVHRVPAWTDMPNAQRSSRRRCNDDGCVATELA